MTTVLVDSNVPIDPLTDNPDWSDWSATALADAGERGRLAINPIIYAEVSIRFSRIEDLDAALPRAMFDREQLPDAAAFVAGKAYIAYGRRGGDRRSPPPDFFIGAHAAVAGYSLLTRDPTRFRSYFPAVRLIAPN